MPHIIVKMYAGRSDAEKSALADEITRAVTKTLGYGPHSISVGIEDIAPKDWAEQVFKPDIAGKTYTLYKQPGYKLSDL